MVRIDKLEGTMMKSEGERHAVRNGLDDSEAVEELPVGDSGSACHLREAWRTEFGGCAGFLMEEINISVAIRKTRGKCDGVFFTSSIRFFSC